MLGKFILGLSALVFTGYGLLSLLSPETPAAFAGIIMSNGDAKAEVSSMYGGLQTGFGIFCLIALSRPEYFRSGLLLLTLVVGLLAAARCLSWLLLSDEVTVYTYGAIAYELLTAVTAGVALRIDYRNSSARSNNAYLIN